MKYVPGPLVGQLSRSQGNTTASHNRFGSYLRNRVVPVNPNTISQTAQRDSLLNRSQEWRALTDAQRAGWAALGQQMIRLDSQGQPYTLTGFQAYCSVNRNLVYIGAAVLPNAPALAIPAPQTSITLTATA